MRLRCVTTQLVRLGRSLIAERLRCQARPTARLGYERFAHSFATKYHARAAAQVCVHSHEGDRDGAGVMGKKNFYAVARGRETGIFESWDACERQVKGFNDNLYKGFSSRAEAEAFLRANGVQVDRTEEAEEVEVHKVEDVKAEKKELDWGDSDSDVDRCINGGGEDDAVVAKPAHICGDVRFERALMFFDGASKRNPGDAGFGAAIFDRDTDRLMGEVTGWTPHETNNVSEYSGLIMGLDSCLKMGVRDIIVRGDSKLVINQVNGSWQVKNENLQR